MEIKFNVTGTERKELVNAISGIVGMGAVYKRAPTFAYVVNNYTIDKNGTLIYDERTSAESVREILTELAGLGFVSEAVPAIDTAPEPNDVDTPDTLSIEMPLEGFTDTALDNLEKLIASKAALIRKSIGADSLAITSVEDRLCFPWFSAYASTEMIGAYTQFVTALCNMAKTQKRITAKEKPIDPNASEKFTMRCFLLRIGFIGSEYAAARKILLANLPGSGSFKSCARKQSELLGTADSGASVGNNDDDAAYALAETMADVELIYQVNTSFEGDSANE